jgi:hypothetical protein
MYGDSDVKLPYVCKYMKRAFSLYLGFLFVGGAGVHYLGGDHSCTKLRCPWRKSGLSPQTVVQPSPA